MRENRCLRGMSSSSYIIAHYLMFSQTEDRDSDQLASIAGIMQAIVSVFLDENDKLRCINAGKTRISFLLRPPLYYVCVSSWGEPESVVSSYQSIHPDAS